MSINITLKTNIMETVKAALDASSDKYIYFKDIDNYILASLPYSTFLPINSSAPNGDYQFFSLGPTPTQLKGKVVISGTPTSFEIPGFIDGDIIPKLIYGKVGNMNSNALIKFVNTIWIANKVVKINKLIFSIGDLV